MFTLYLLGYHNDVEIYPIQCEQCKFSNSVGVDWTVIEYLINWMLINKKNESLDIPKFSFRYIYQGIHVFDKFSSRLASLMIFFVFFAVKLLSASISIVPVKYFLVL